MSSDAQDNSATTVHNHVARLSISTDIERKEMVSMIKSTIGEKNSDSDLKNGSVIEDGPENRKDREVRRRRRRSSAQTVITTVKKKKKVKPVGIDVDPKIVSRKINIGDIRDLILYVFDELPNNIRWLTINNRLSIKKVLVLFVPGLSHKDFGLDNIENICKPIPLDSLQVPKELELFKSFFKYIWPTKSPGSKVKLYSTYQSLVNVPLNKSERKKTQDKVESKITLHNLLMSVDDMIENGYPVHSFYKKGLRPVQAQQIGKFEGNLESSEWVETRDFEHEGSKTFAVDCEMCLAGSEKVLTRVSLINFNNEVVIDEYVKPELEITDYVTRYSGITAEHLEGVTITLQDIQQRILAAVSADDVLIGHSLESDLNVLKIKHKAMIDTALIYDHRQGLSWKPSLRWLVQNFLGRDIQNNVNGHDSVEDAKACMDLVKLKLQNGLNFGKVAATTTDIFSKINAKVINKCVTSNQKLATDSEAVEQNIFSLRNGLRKSLAIDYSKPSHFIGKPFNLIFGEKLKCESDDEATELLINRIDQFDFITARLREAEYFNGWVSQLDANATEKSDKLAVAENNGKQDDLVTKAPDDSSSKAAGAQPVEASIPESIDIQGSTQPLKENLDAASVYKNLSHRLQKIIDSLPSSTLLVVSTSSGDPRKMIELQQKKKKFQSECTANTANNSSWTSDDEEELKKAVEAARDCVSFIGLKPENSGSMASVKAIPSLDDKLVLESVESVESAVVEN